MKKGHQLHAEVIAALLKGPRTTRDLMDYTGTSRTTMGAIIAAYRAAGVLCQTGTMTDTAGRPNRVFALQTTPFAQKDIT